LPFHRHAVDIGVGLFARRQRPAQIGVIGQEQLGRVIRQAQIVFVKFFGRRRRFVLGQSFGLHLGETWPHCANQKHRRNNKLFHHFSAPHRIIPRYRRCGIN
jgi:hypothetical protein